MRKKFLFIPALLLLFAAVSFPSTGFFVKDTVLVTRVIDGDTLEIQGGERVRLLGIDTPEKGQYFSSEATQLLKGLVEKKKVHLEKDKTDKDKYGRLLRYLYVGDVFVNLEIIKKGLASSLSYEPDTRFEEIFLKEESQARAENKGIWSLENKGDLFCIGVYYLHSNAKGNDNQNLNDEYVQFRNKCFHPLPLKGWTVKDSSSSSFVFPSFSLANKTIVTLHTGSGKNNQTDLFWGKSIPVWNNNGDALLVWDAQGKLMLNYSYPQ